MAGEGGEHRGHNGERGYCVNERRLATNEAQVLLLTGMAESNSKTLSRLADMMEDIGRWQATTEALAQRLTDFIEAEAKVHVLLFSKHDELVKATTDEQNPHSLTQRLRVQEATGKDVRRIFRLNGWLGGILGALGIAGLVTWIVRMVRVINAVGPRP